MPGTNMPGTSKDLDNQNHRSKKTTQRQFEIMIDFISKHREMEHQKFTPSFTQKDKDELWRELTNLLNADGYGPLKKADKWRKVSRFLIIIYFLRIKLLFHSKTKAPYTCLYV